MLRKTINKRFRKAERYGIKYKLKSLQTFSRGVITLTAPRRSFKKGLIDTSPSELKRYKKREVILQSLSP